MSKTLLKKISLNNLLINLENPRFEKVVDEKMALQIMTEDKPDKLLKLANDMLDWGLNPSDPIYVTPSLINPKKYTVLEGNRRISILKILKSPKLISKTNPAFFKKLMPLIKKFENKPITSIEARIYSKAKDADKWIELKHTGENDGIGTVSWDSTQQARFNSEVKGHSPIALQAIEFLSNSTFTEEKLKKDLKKISYTNIERLLTDPNVRETIGLSYNNKSLSTNLEEEEVVKGLSKIAKDFLYNSYTVNKIRTKKDRALYLEEYDADTLPDKQKTTDNWKLLAPRILTSNVPTSKSGNINKSPNTPIPLTRKSLIPRDCLLRIEEKRINEIYHELKSLQVEDYENATSVLFRVFIELCVDAFILKKNGKIKGVKKMTPLRDKIEKTAKYFEDAKIMTDHELKGIYVLLNNPHEILSIDTFNAYVHNMHYSPNSNDLKKSWDNIQIFVEKLWATINK